MKRAMAAAALAACLLAGCARPAAPAEGGLAMLTAPDGFAYRQAVSTREGLYEPVRDETGVSAHIFYTDYATATRQYLCADPACAHNTDACAGYIPDAGELFGLFCQGEALYLYIQPADGAPALYRSGLNGAGRSLFFSFSADTAPQGGIAAGEGGWYYLNDQAQADGGRRVRLLRFDPEARSCETLAELPGDGSACYLVGVAAGRLLVQQTGLPGETDARVYACDPATGELTTLLTCPEGLVCRAVGDALVYWRQGAAELRALEVAGGGDRALYTGPVLGEGTTLQMDGPHDGRLLVQARREIPMSQVDWAGLPEGTRQGLADYLKAHQADMEQELGHPIDPTDLPGVYAELDRYSREHGGYGITMSDWRFLAADPAGETRELALRQPDDPTQPVTVLGESEEAFCVAVGVEEQPVTYWDPEGKPYEGRITRLRTALIPKADYYAGKENYREVLDQ